METVSELELSVRTANVCRAAGIISIEDFLAITKTEFMKFPNAGVRSWSEVEKTQQLIHYIRSGAYAWEEFENAVLEVNKLMLKNAGFAVSKLPNGRIAPFKIPEIYR